MKRFLAAALLPAAAAAMFAALRSPQLQAYRGAGLRLDIPASWKVRAVESPHLRRLSLQPDSGPPLLIEDHRRSTATLSDAARLLGAKEPLAVVHLGEGQAWQARVRSEGGVKAEAQSARSEPPSDRQYYFLSRSGDLVIASYAVPSGAYRAWKLDRLCRAVLASLQIGSQ